MRCRRAPEPSRARLWQRACNAGQRWRLMDAHVRRAGPCTEVTESRSTAARHAVKGRGLAVSGSGAGSQRRTSKEMFSPSRSQSSHRMSHWHLLASASRLRFMSALSCGPHRGREVSTQVGGGVHGAVGGRAFRRARGGAMRDAVLAAADARQARGLQRRRRT
jgi:hypothetical protein